MKLVWLLVAVYSLLPFPSWAQPNRVKFDRLSVERGLSESTVTCIHQDREGFLWFGTQDGLNKYDGYSFTVYRRKVGAANSLSNNFILGLTTDRYNNLWIATSQGLNRLNLVTDQFTTYHDTPPSPVPTSVQAIAVDQTGRLWVGTNGGLRFFDFAANRLQAPQALLSQASLLNTPIRSLYEDRRGNLWVGTETGLCRIDSNRRSVQAFVHEVANPQSLGLGPVLSIGEDAEGQLWVGTELGGIGRLDAAAQAFSPYSVQNGAIPHNDIRAICRDKQGQLWVGTNTGGLLRYDKETDRFVQYPYEADNPNGITSSTIMSLLTDRQGTLWIGTFAGGVNYFTPFRNQFQTYKASRSPYSLSDKNARSMAVDRQGNLLIGLRATGINHLDRAKGLFSRLPYATPTAQVVNHSPVMAVYEDRQGNRYAGVYAGGFVYWNRATNAFTHYRQQTNDTTSLLGSFVHAFLQDKKGRIWVGTMEGLNRFDPQTGRFIRYATGAVRKIIESRDGQLLLATNGLVAVDPITQSTRRYALSAGTEVISLCEDAQGRLWLGTRHHGLGRYDRRRQSVTFFTEKEGLPNNTVHSVLADQRGNLWLSTNNGLSQYSPATNTFRNYDARDGLHGNQFNSNSAAQSPDGQLFFGGVDGMTAFFPDSIRPNTFVPPVVITSLRLFNRPVLAGEKDSPLRQSVRHTKSITFTHDQNVVTFDFVALNYVSPDKNEYAYFLDGFEKSWNYVGEKHTATYTNLNPGTYHFRVKASNNDGVWNETGTRIELVVLPPWWQTWWAYLLYALLLAGITLTAVQYWLARQRFRNELQVERQVNQLKLHLFTNISHEFRTPLTLIVSPLEQLLANGAWEAGAKQQLELIHRNAQRLLRLINQLLDFRKVEEGNLKLELGRGDLIDFIRRIIDSFASLAHQHELRLSFDSNLPEWHAWFDADKLDKIVYNLLSNALKFTPAGGTIAIQATADTTAAWLTIEVSDTGTGIPTSQLPAIFERFYQASNRPARQAEGSGIGLALVKELVDCWQGEIAVTSEVGRGTTFRVKLPMTTHTAPYSPLVAATSEAHTEAKPRTEDLAHEKPLVLLVEDSDDMRLFIKEALQSDFEVMEAPDGLTGLEKALETVPDLIISDVMMPRMDGMALCERLKSDEKTSHIPVILLTSRASETHKLAGLAQGADDYLTKPFKVAELQVRMENLIQSRKKLREKFSRELVLEPSQVVITSADEQFLQKAIAAVERYLTDTELNADVLGHELGMSRTQLYRKLKALTDQSVNEFIRLIRLKRACQLLAESQLTVTEIAYQVGFSSQSYFSKCFTEHFGQSPSEYAAAIN